MTRTQDLTRSSATRESGDKARRRFAAAKWARIRRPVHYFIGVPRHWFWMQLAILVFVLAGMVIAITKLA
jgi:hypothetical protein